jgi:hypothetical protein
MAEPMTVAIPCQWEPSLGVGTPTETLSGGRLDGRSGDGA